MIMTTGGNQQQDNSRILAQGSRKVKNKLPITWIGKLILPEDALVIFNCSAENSQRDRTSLAVLVSITVDGEHASHNAIPSLSIDDRATPHRCSVNLTVFLEKGEHTFKMTGKTSGMPKAPSTGLLSYDYCAIAIPDKAEVCVTAEQKARKKSVRKKTSKKKVTGKAGNRKTKKKINRP